MLTLLKTRQLESDLDDEVRFHIEMETEKNIKRGMDRDEARREAMRDFGGVEVTKEHVREESRARFLETLLQDLRYGFRRLKKRPGFTAIAIVMMALGIGANTTIFSVVNRILLSPLPYKEPDRLYRIYGRNDIRGWQYSSLSQPNYVDLRDRNATFEEIGAYTAGNAVLTGESEPLQLSMGLASASLFHLLGIEPQYGRNFLPEEDADGIEPQVVLLSNELWRTQFGEDPAIVGRTLVLNNSPVTVVGVLPAGENWLQWYDLYIPLRPEPDGDRGNNIIWAFGRLKSGVSITQAQADMDALASSIVEEFPEDNEMTGVTMMPLDEWLIGGDIRTVLWVLMAAVGFVLLIACANLANMLLARATGRRREIAVSTALGAGRLRIVRQMLTESTLLTLIGGLFGILLAFWLIGALKALDPGGIPRLSLVTINGWVCSFTFGVTVLVGLLSGLAPALQAPTANVSEALKEGARTAISSRQHRIRNTLVVTEMALSLMLLIGAGLMIRSFVVLRTVDRGFQTDNRLLFDITLPDSEYGENETLIQFFNGFLPRIESIPVVEAVGAVSAAPIEGLNTNMGYHVAGHLPGPDESMPLADWRNITPDYFKVLGLPMLQGRTFDDLSIEEAVPYIDRELEEYRFNVVISEGVAQTLWPDSNPIGRQFCLWSEANNVGEVIGVVADMRERGLERDPRHAVYISYAVGLWNPVTFIIHTAGDPVSVMPSIRTILAEIDADLPISNIRAFDEIVTDSVATRRFTTFLLIIFAGIALILACAGIYGVMAYSVTERHGEIAIRMTLGARPAGVVRLIVGHGMKLALLGTVIGLVAAVGLSQLITGMLFGVTPVDAITYLLVTLILISTAVLSNYIPALRATKVNPVNALREE